MTMFSKHARNGVVVSSECCASNGNAKCMAQCDDAARRKSAEFRVPVGHNGRVDMRYDIEADWKLLTTCNFRCEYCFINVNDLSAKIKVYGTAIEWSDAFNATGKTWLLHVTGGEPTIYPDFVAVCEQLTRGHYLSINSNLAHRSIEAFAERVDPRRVHFINAAVHYAERQKKNASLDVFIERVHKLHKYGFNVLVSMVMTPNAVRDFPEYSEHFESRGLSLIPKTMRDQYQGDRYPRAYTNEQRALIREYLTRASQKYAAVIGNMGEPATIDMFADARFLDNIGNYRGKVCGSGYNFVAIEPDGTVVRCGSGKRLGNVLWGTLRLLRAPRACDTAYCPYFCEKYTSPKFVREQESEQFTQKEVQFKPGGAANQVEYSYTFQIGGPPARSSTTCAGTEQEGQIE